MKMTSTSISTSVISAAFVVVADLDLDGDLDVIFGNTEQPWLSLHRNVDGGRTFEAMSSALTNAGNGGANIAKGLGATDIDADGDVDLLVAASSSPWSNVIYTNNRGGAYTALSGLDVLTNVEATMQVSLVDFDADGDLDIYVANGCCRFFGLGPSGSTPSTEANKLHRTRAPATPARRGRAAHACALYPGLGAHPL